MNKCIHGAESTICKRCLNKKQEEFVTKKGYLGTVLNNIDLPDYIKEDRTVEQYSRFLK